MNSGRPLSACRWRVSLPRPPKRTRRHIHKVLTDTLRRAELDGLVTRRLDQDRVEAATLYMFTDPARPLDEPLANLGHWVQVNGHGSNTDPKMGKVNFVQRQPDERGAYAAIIINAEPSPVMRRTGRALRGRTLMSAGGGFDAGRPGAALAEGWPGSDRWRPPGP